MARVVKDGAAACRYNEGGKDYYGRLVHLVARVRAPTGSRRHQRCSREASMTGQEIFDAVAIHLLTQKRKSVGANGVCRYRWHGLRCAIGCLIPDAQYTPGLEHCSGPHNYSVRVAAGILDNQVPLVAALQNVHDVGFASCWPSRLRQVSSDFRLDGGVLDVFEAEAQGA